MLRIGIIGTGGMAKERVRCFARMEGVQVDGVYARTAQNAGRFAEQSGLKAYDNYRQMLAAVDAVVICVPNDLHAQFATEAMRTSRHVLIEYPLATSLEDAARLRNVAIAYKCICMAGNTIVHESPFAYINQNKDRLGGIISASSRTAFYSDGLSRSWLFDRQRLGPVFAAMHYHHIEFYKHLLGEPTWVLGCDESAVDAASGSYGNFVVGTLVMGHGTHKTACVQWYLSTTGNGLARSMCINGMRSTLTLTSLGTGRMQARWEDAATDPEFIEESWGVEGSCQDFVMALEGRLDSKKRLDEDIHTLRIALAARDSAKVGRIVHLD
jgi:predicted dehydrogenase